MNLKDFHQALGARFLSVADRQLVADYGDPLREHAALRERAALLDLTQRSRICITGTDRVRFLHGQVTNDVKALRVGTGCYAALVTAKGKMQSDLNIFSLPEELLCDFEAGYTNPVLERLEKYVIADDVQLVDVAPLYGLLSIQGPLSNEVIGSLTSDPPGKPFGFVTLPGSDGELYVINRPRIGTLGFDVFVPIAGMGTFAEKLMEAVRAVQGCAAGWTALELARVEAGIPRFGVDIDETNIPLEAGLENNAISFAKGCYIGQEVISRIKTYGQVAKALRGLRLADDLTTLPGKSDHLLHQGKEVGYITSAVASPALKANIALGYVRKEVNQIGNRLTLRIHDRESEAQIVPLPFTSR
jgi:folate-binding protein YgfZ